MGRFLLSTLALLALVATVGFGKIWLDRARMDYNSEGRYFDEQAGIVYDQSGVLFFCVLTLASILLVTITFGVHRYLGKR